MEPNDQEIVRGTTLFQDISPSDFDFLISVAVPLTLEKGCVVFHQGEPAVNVYVVLEGHVKLSRLTASGDEAVVQIYGAGETFAEAAALMEGRYPVTAAALDPTRLLGISHQSIHARVSADPRFAFAMMASMARHLKSLIQQIEQVKLLTSDQRLATYFLALQQHQKGGDLRLPAEKAVIARLLGMTPENFSRSLARLKRIGVSSSGSRIVIDDPVKIRLWLEED